MAQYWVTMEGYFYKSVEAESLRDAEVQAHVLFHKALDKAGWHRPGEPGFRILRETGKEIKDGHVSS